MLARYPRGIWRESLSRRYSAFGRALHGCRPRLCRLAGCYLREVFRQWQRRKGLDFLALSLQSNGACAACAAPPSFCSPLSRSLDRNDPLLCSMAPVPGLKGERRGGDTHTHTLAQTELSSLSFALRERCDHVSLAAPARICAGRRGKAPERRVREMRRGVREEASKRGSPCGAGQGRCVAQEGDGDGFGELSQQN